MTTITLNDLHEHTAEWLYGSDGHHEIMVMDQGKPLARIQRLSAVASSLPTRKPFWDADATSLLKRTSHFSLGAMPAREERNER